MEGFFQLYGVGLVAGGLLFLVLYAILDYAGLFLSVVVRRVRNGMGRLRVAYLYNVGPYKDCGPLFDRANKLAPHHRCIGVYYDDPKTTPSSELRYIVGSVLAEGNEPVDKDVLDDLRADGFRVAEFPASEDALAAEFPFPWMVSIFFAVWKVYPKLAKFMNDTGVVSGPCIEIYSGTKINFCVPIGNFEGYLVPEAHHGSKVKSS